MNELQLCGHPIACIVSSDDGTNYCGWCADVARLREALNSLLSALATGHHEIINRAVRKAEAALTDTADDWQEKGQEAMRPKTAQLVRAAQEQARQTERERCAMLVQKNCQKCKGRGSILVLTQVGQAKESPCQRCQPIAAAIREGNDDI